MLPGWVIFASAFAYLLLLFAVASYGDRKSRAHGVPENGRPIVYALSLAVYCTSWTYFGGVGLAAEHGLEFTAIYIGPILMFTIGMPIVRRIIDLGVEASPLVPAPPSRAFGRRGRLAARQHRQPVGEVHSYGTA